MKVLLNRERFLIILTKKNKDYDWLAQQLGTSAKYVSYIVNGNRGLSPELRNRLQAIFPGRKWDDLFRIKFDESTTANSYR